MMRKLAAILLAGLLAALLIACGSETPAATDTPVPPTAVAEPTQAPTGPPDTPAPAPTATAVPTEAPAPTDTPAPTEAPAPTPVPTAAPAPTNTPEPTATPEPEDTPTPEPTAMPEPTAAPEPTAEPEPTAAPTPTPEPDVPPIAAALAPLGDNLIWVAHYDNPTKDLSVYDPSGTFSLDEVPLPPGLSISDTKPLTELDVGKIYWIMASRDQTVQLGSQNVIIRSGFNFISWR